MNAVTKNAMRGIYVIPGPTTKNVSTVEIQFKPGNFDLAVAFAQWLEEHVGKKAHVCKDVGGVVTVDKAR